MKTAAFLSALLIFQSISPLLCSTPSPGTPGTRASCQSLGVPPDDGRLRLIRAEMRRRTSVLGAELDAYIIPTYDEHQSETPSNRDRRLLYLTGFSGSDGVAVVTMNNAALWTDGRYHIQADKELSCHWLLMKHEETNNPSLPQWLNGELSRGARVGADPRLIPHHLWEQWENVLSLMGIYLVQVPNNLVDILWEKDERPLPSRVQIYKHHNEFAGKIWQVKVAELRKELRDHEVDAMVVTALDELAWLLNVRGKDLPYSPVAKAYLILTHEQLHLYVEPTKVSIEAKLSLRADVCFNPNCTKLHAYDSIWSDLRTLSQAWNAVLLPSFYSFSPGVSEAIYTSVPEEKRVYKQSPIINMKAKKNPTEIAGMRRAHIRDGAAMCDVLSYLEERLQIDEGWDEMKVVKVLDITRKSQENNKGLSFATIAGYGPHGALPHYQPTNETSSLILKDSTFVLDSGGQYDDGTTDISRTLHYGKPTYQQRKAYTHVLIASIDLSMMVFPADLKINDIDIIARKELWKERKDYMHSTGHGIGSFLQAHEAPIQIAYGQRQKTTFKPGYFFSNEPGFYEEGKFGVRLENILEVEEFTGGNHNDGNTYLKFTDITLVPYEPKLIDLNMLSQYQRRWLNDYNIRIREVIGAELKRKTNMKAFHWMMNKTVLVPEYGIVDNASNLYVSKVLIILMAITLTIQNMFKFEY